MTTDLAEALKNVPVGRMKVNVSARTISTLEKAQRSR